MPHTEYLFLALSLFLLLSYHFILRWMIKHNPMHTEIGVNSCVRRAWVKHMMQRPTGDVLAVQTLRNTLMSASFFASSAILLVAGLLSFTVTEKNLESFNHVLNLFGYHEFHMVLTRLLVLISLFFFAFFNFLLTMRYYNNLGFMLNALGQVDRRVLSEQLVSNAMQRGALHFTLGIRTLMLVLPFGLWLLGAVWLLVGTVILLIMLYHIDYPHYLRHTHTECHAQSLSTVETKA